MLLFELQRYSWNKSLEVEPENLIECYNSYNKNNNNIYKNVIKYVLYKNNNPLINFYHKYNDWSITIISIGHGNYARCYYNLCAIYEMIIENQNYINNGWKLMIPKKINIILAGCNIDVVRKNHRKILVSF